MRILPWREDFLEGLLGADLIGFHTQSYMTHFLNCCERISGFEVDRQRNEVRVGTRTVRVGAFPLGIPADFFSELAASPSVVARARRIRQALRTRATCAGYVLGRIYGLTDTPEQKNEQAWRWIMMQLLPFNSKTYRRRDSYERVSIEKLCHVFIRSRTDTSRTQTYVRDVNEYVQPL